MLHYVNAIQSRIEQRMVEAESSLLFAHHTSFSNYFKHKAATRHVTMSSLRSLCMHFKAHIYSFTYGYKLTKYWKMFRLYLQIIEVIWVQKVLKMTRELVLPLTMKRNMVCQRTQQVTNKDILLMAWQVSTAYLSSHF